jgi:electron transport complex protein RnfA
MSWVGIIVTFALVDNVLLSRLLGVDTALCVPGSMRSAIGIGTSTAILMAVSAFVGWVVSSLLLVPLGLEILRTPAFVLAVAAIALLMESAARRLAPGMVRSWGVSLPEVAVNCASVGVVLIVTRSGYGALESIVGGLSAGAGYLMVTAVMTAIREKLDVESVPRAFRGLPLHLISAGLLAYAFLAFDRAFLSRVLGG